MNPVGSVFLLIGFCFIIGYLLGSINLSILITKYILKKDIREHGSYNPGATNTVRVYGKKVGALIFIFDFLKGIIPVVICWCISKFWLANYINLLKDFNYNFFIYLAGIFATIGHIFPVFFKFNGGKGVATSSGFILVISPFIFIICAICFVCVAIKKKIIAVASISAAIIFPFLLLFPGLNYMYLFESLSNINALYYANMKYYAFYGFILFIFGLPLSCLIIYKHKSNILKLRQSKLK